MKKPVIETREKIVEIPCVQVQERVVEHPEIHVQEVTKRVPKVMEVQEIVKNVQRVDWTGTDTSMLSGGSVEAPTLPPCTPGGTRYVPIGEGPGTPSARSVATVDISATPNGLQERPQFPKLPPLKASCELEAWTAFPWRFGWKTWRKTMKSHEKTW